MLFKMNLKPVSLSLIWSNTNKTNKNLNIETYLVRWGMLHFDVCLQLFFQKLFKCSKSINKTKGLIKSGDPPGPYLRDCIGAYSSGVYVAPYKALGTIWLPLQHREKNHLNSWYLPKWIGICTQKVFNYTLIVNIYEELHFIIKRWISLLYRQSPTFLLLT